MVSVLLMVGFSCSKDSNSDNGAAEKNGKITLETPRQKTSYAIGYQMGLGLKNVIQDVDIDIIFKGIQDSAVNSKEQLTKEEMQKILQEFTQTMNQRMMEKRRIDGEKNKTEGETFLKANASKPGVKVTASGLQYMVIIEGTGLKPTKTDRIKVHYRGTLLDGTEFDNSYNRGQPAVFPLEGFIPGWIEGVLLMKVGSKYKFFLPSGLAYGDRGAGAIGPNAVIVFEVELLGIEPPQPNQQQAPAGK